MYAYLQEANRPYHCFEFYPLKINTNNKPTIKSVIGHALNVGLKCIYPVIKDAKRTLP